MPVQAIHTYLVHPRADGEDLPVGGVSPVLEGKLFDLLNEVYQKSPHECDIDISFDRQTDGGQQNDCRDLITAFISDPSIENGRVIAARLRGFSTRRSGIGLLFLIYGTEGGAHRLVISRFPTSTAILAEETSQDLSVEFLERVFMKSEHSYKAVAYNGTSLAGDFWDGRATDKQIGNPSVQISSYWIREFLASDFRTTSAAGTRRLAEALRSAARVAPTVEIKQEIAAAATLGSALQGQTSIHEFLARYSLSAAAQEVVGRQLRNSEALTERFLFDAEEYSRQVVFRSVELDNGAILTAHASDFDAVFTQESISAGSEVRFTTEGQVVGENLRKAR